MKCCISFQEKYRNGNRKFKGQLLDVFVVAKTAREFNLQVQPDLSFIITGKIIKSSSVVLLDN